MRGFALALVWLAAAVGLAACPAAVPSTLLDDGPRSHSVYVVDNGWHTAIVVPGPALRAAGLLPEAEDFPAAAYLEFGWGDRVYYPAKDPGLAMALEAALSPTPAVMHVAGLAAPPMQLPEGNQVVSLTLTQSGLRSMLGAIAGEFTRPDGKRAAPLSPGLYPQSKFYEAEGAFHLFNTCNTWTARMLQAGGVALSSSGVVTADDLMDRLRAAADVD